MSSDRAVQQHLIPERVLGLSTMAPASYVDCFTAPLPDAPTADPEHWARAAVEGASAVGRFLAWRLLLGLRLEPTPAHVGGWRIDGRGDSWIRLAARSRFLTAHMVFHVDAERVWFVTFLRYDRPVARLVWTQASVIHRAVAPGFLDAAVTRMARPRA